MRLTAATSLALLSSLATLPACSETASGTAAAENTAQACSDQADNDGDGWSDCADQDCWDFVFCADDVTDTTAGDAAASSDTGATSADSGALTDSRADDDARPDGQIIVTPGDCDPCGNGSVRGRVCAPNRQVYVNDARVVLTGTGCDGQPFTLETRSDADGNWFFGLIKDGTDISEMRETLIFGPSYQGGASADPLSAVAALPPEAEICGCNGVCKGDIQGA